MNKLHCVKENHDKPFYYMVLLMALLFVLRDCFSFNISQFIFLGLASLFFIISNYDRCVYLTICALPLLCGMQGFIATAALFMLFLKAPKVNVWQWVPLLIIGILEILNWGGVSKDSSIKEYILLCSSVGLFFFFTGGVFDNFSKAKMLRYYIYSSSFVLFLVVYRSITYLGIDGLLSAGFRGTNVMEMAGLEYDMQTHFALNANSQAFFSIVNIAILLLGQNKLEMKRIPYYVVLIISFIAGIVSFSRTWILLILFLCTASVMLTKGKKRLTLIVSLLVLVAGFMVSGFADPIIDSFIGRFEDDSLETGSGRTEILAHYNKLWIDDPVKILVGTGAIDYAYKSHYGHSIHNGIQQVYYCYGILGFICFLSVFIHYFRKIRNKKLSWLSMLPFVVCFLFDQSIQFLNPHYLMFPFIASMFASELHSSEF